MATGLNGSESADFYRDDGGCTIRPAPVFSDEKEDPNRCRHEVFNTLASTILQQHAHQPLIPSETGFILNLVQKMLTGTAPRLFVMMASDIIRWLFFLWASYCYRQQFRLPAPILFISPLVALVEKVGILFQNFQKQDSLRVQCLYEGAVDPGIMHQVINGKVDVLLLAPEMLEKVLQSYKLPRILFACIDNAECVVEFQVYRHTYLRLNKLLEGLGVKYLLGLSALAVDSTAISVKGQFELKESMTIPGCHSPVIPANVQLRVCASCSNKDEQLVELFEDLNPLRLIVICDSGDKIEHVSEMLQRRLSSFSTRTESADATDTGTNENGKRRKSGSHLETSKRCKCIVVVEKYVRKMSLSEKKSVSDRFDETNEIDVVVTTPALCMGLPRADVIIYYTMPRTYESLMKGIYQVRRQQQGYVYVLQDKQHLQKFRRSTMKIPDSRTIEKQVEEIFEGEFSKTKGISDEHFGFILGSLESDGYLKLAGPISDCHYLEEGYHCPDQHELKQISTDLQEGLVKQAKSRVKVYKQFDTDLSSSDNDLENRIARKFIPHELSAGTSVNEPEQVNTKPGKQKRVTTTSQESKSSIHPLQQQSLQDSTTAGFQTNGYSQAAASDILDDGDHLDITTYLIKLDTTAIYNLGLVLGLSQIKVKKMKDSDNIMFLDEVIAAWLRRENHVEKRGMPTWKVLVAALKHERVNQNGIAGNISRDHEQ